MLHFLIECAMRKVHCSLAFLTLLGSYKYHVIILVDQVLLHSIDLPIAEKVMYSIFAQYIAYLELYTCRFCRTYYKSKLVK